MTEELSDTKSFSRFHLSDEKDFQVKELFKDIAAYAQDYFDNGSPSSILDVGCAAGELPFYLKKRLNVQNVVGLDIDPELIMNARERFGSEDIEFQVDDARDFEFDRSFDLITAVSLLSYFDAPESIITNILNHLSKDGLAIITGLFNEYGYDVRVRHRKSSEDADDWESGFNQHALETVRDILNGHGYELTVEEQVMPFDLEQKEKLLRSWSVSVDGTRHNTNALQMIWNIKILLISSE